MKLTSYKLKFKALWIDKSRICGLLADGRIFALCPEEVWNKGSKNCLRSKWVKDVRVWPRYKSFYYYLNSDIDLNDHINSGGYDDGKNIDKPIKIKAL